MLCNSLCSKCFKICKSVAELKSPRCSINTLTFLSPSLGRGNRRKVSCNRRYTPLNQRGRLNESGSLAVIPSTPTGCERMLLMTLSSSSGFSSAAWNVSGSFSSLAFPFGMTSATYRPKLWSFMDKLSACSNSLPVSSMTISQLAFTGRWRRLLGWCLLNWGVCTAQSCVWTKFFFLVFLLVKFAQCDG